jgi:hypothetical protein
MLTRTRDIPKPAEPITDARELAGVLATVVTNYPHLMARTDWATARTADGIPVDARHHRAVRFCAGGLIRRAAAAGATTKDTAQRLIFMLGDLLPDELGPWWETAKPEPTPADYAALLRRVAEA